MNKLYIDLYSKNEEKEKLKGRNKIFTGIKRICYKVKNAFKNYKFQDYENNMAIKVDIDFLNSISIRQNRKYSFEEKKILKIISNKFSDDNQINSVRIIFSDRLYNMHNNKKYLLELINNIYNIKFINVVPENQMLEHDLEHIKRYCLSNKIKKDKIKVLVAISNVSCYNNNKIVQYINNFKEVDILVTDKLSKKEIAIIKENIDKINNEYGTSIDVILSKRDIKKYNVYIIYSKIDRQKFLSKYIINKKSNYIDVNNIDEDFLNDGYKLFVKNERSIKETLLNLKLNINNFSMVTLGASFK